MESRFKWTWKRLRPSRSDVSVQISLYKSVRDSGIVGVIADPTILCLDILESAILAIDGLKLSVHVDDEDDGKHVFQLKLNHS